MVSADTSGAYQIGELTQGIRETADEVGSERSTVAIPTYVTLTPYEAVTGDVGKYGLIWTFAVVLELFPLLILIGTSMFVLSDRMTSRQLTWSSVTDIRRKEQA